MKYIGYTIVILVAVILLIPLAWMVFGSFQSTIELMKMPPTLISGNMNFDNYKDLFEYPAWRWLRNSITVSLCSVLLTIPINIMAGYAFAKKRFRGKEILFNMFLFTMIIPSQITLIPSFLLMRSFGLYNSLLAMWLPSGVSVFMLFFFRQFLSSIPNDYLDIATIDGCGEIRKFTNIIIPLAAPAIVTMALIGFVGQWGNFLWQFIIISREKLYTLPVGIVQLLIHKAVTDASIPHYGISFAAATFAFLPILIVFIAGNRFYMKGLFSGGMKG